jgi:succinate dehydrogenase hydrophobic anchor subunit
LKFLLASPQAIHIGIHITGCMAQITNISNSADSTPMTLSTTPSDDEDDTNEHHQFLSPSSDLNSTTTNNGVVTPHTVVKIHNNDNDSQNLDNISYDIQPTKTTLNTPQLNTYLNLSTTSSETSLARPLIEQHQTLPIYTSPINNEDERTASSASSTTSTVSSTSSIIPNCRSYVTLYFTDMLISAFIITPFVNIHWRGAWDLLDIHLLPDSPQISSLISLGIGYFMLYVLYLTQGYLQSFYEKNRHNIMGQIMTRLYTLILALAYIHQWRGLWSLLDSTSNEWYHLLGETVVCIIFLLLMQSIYNLNSAPFIIGIDTESYFLLDSKYTVTTNHFWQYTFDFSYYEIVEGPLLIIAWHGLYNISDLYIYPDNKTRSMIVSFASGYLVYFVLALIQIPVVRYLLRQRHKFLHTIITNLFHLIAFASVVQIWRSLWLVCEQYLNITNYHNTTLWLCYGVSFVVLTCGLAACSLNGPGGSKDSYIDEGPILLFKFDYFSTLLKRKSSHLKSEKGVSLSSDVSSTETIMTGERPYGFEPP